jgi:hypothetical protein
VAGLAHVHLFAGYHHVGAPGVLRSQRHGMIGIHADHDKSPAAAGLFYEEKGFSMWERLPAAITRF